MNLYGFVGNDVISRLDFLGLLESSTIDVCKYTIAVGHLWEINDGIASIKGRKRRPGARIGFVTCSAPNGTVEAIWGEDALIPGVGGDGLLWPDQADGHGNTIDRKSNSNSPISEEPLALRRLTPTLTNAITNAVKSAKGDCASNRCGKVEISVVCLGDYYDENGKLIRGYARTALRASGIESWCGRKITVDCVKCDGKSSPTVRFWRVRNIVEEVLPATDKPIDYEGEANSLGLRELSQ